MKADFGRLQPTVLLFFCSFPPSFGLKMGLGPVDLSSTRGPITRRACSCHCNVVSVSGILRSPQSLRCQRMCSGVHTCSPRVYLFSLMSTASSRGSTADVPWSPNLTTKGKTPSRQRDSGGLPRASQERLLDAGLSAGAYANAYVP